MLASETLFREEMTGSAPWWFAFEENQDAGNLITKADGTASNAMVVGDRGLVVREFSARLGGVIRSSPSFSLLCDKIEIGTPKGLRSLQKDDYVDMSLEFLVLPRSGEEYEAAKTNSKASRTLQALARMTTSQRVEAQANGGLRVTATRGSLVESQYRSHTCYGKCCL